jgi:phage terminase small subunit
MEKVINLTNASINIGYAENKAAVNGIRLKKETTAHFL